MEPAEPGVQANIEGGVELLQFLNDIPIYRFDREQAVFIGLDKTASVECRVTKAAIIMRAQLKSAGPSELISAVMGDRPYFEEVARAIYARANGAYVTIDTRDISGPYRAVA